MNNECTYLLIRNTLQWNSINNECSYKVNAVNNVYA